MLHNIAISKYGPLACNINAVDMTTAGMDAIVHGEFNWD